MTLLAIENEMKRLKSCELNELQSYLIRLRSGKPGWKRATARNIRAVQAGKFIAAESLKK
jgi:hypothetical protein